MRRSPKVSLLCATLCAAAVGLAVIPLPSVAGSSTDSGLSGQEIADARKAINSSTSDAALEGPPIRRGESQMAKEIAMQKMMFAKSLEKVNAKAKKTRTAAIVLGVLLGITVLTGLTGVGNMILRRRMGPRFDLMESHEGGEE